MGSSLWRCSEAARRLFAEADLAAGLPLTETCFEGPPDRLTDTAFAQPAVVATSLAAAEALKERLGVAGLPLNAACCAGHSVGELAALAFAGAITHGDCLRLVAARGRLMADASALVDGAMAAVLGLDESALEDVCRRASEETGATVQVANLNAPGQVVLSGDRRALARASELARAAGARRVVGLEVSGPFHSTYMEPASRRFRAFVAEITISAPSVPVVLNVTALPCRDPEEIRRELAVQVTSPVRWADSMRTIWEMGCTVFVELGPGQVLSGLARRTAKDALVLNVEDEESLLATTERLRQLLL